MVFLCELCTIIVYSHLTSVILTDTFTSIMTISTSLVLPVCGYMENKETNEWVNNHSRYKNGVYCMGLKLISNLPPTVTSLSHIKVHEVVHNVCCFIPPY